MKGKHSSDFPDTNSLTLELGRMVCTLTPLDNMHLRLNRAQSIWVRYPLAAGRIRLVWTIPVVTSIEEIRQ